MFRLAIISHFHCLVMAHVLNNIALIIIINNFLISFSSLFSLYLIFIIIVYLFIYSFFPFD